MKLSWSSFSFFELASCQMNGLLHISILGFLCKRAVISIAQAVFEEAIFLEKNYVFV